MQNIINTYFKGYLKLGGKIFFESITNLLLMNSPEISVERHFRWN